jgi:hypothetical protein
MGVEGVCIQFSSVDGWSAATANCHAEIFLKFSLTDPLGISLSKNIAVAQ